MMCFPGCLYLFAGGAPCGGIRCWARCYPTVICPVFTTIFTPDQTVFFKTSLISHPL